MRCLLFFVLLIVVYCVCFVFCLFCWIVFFGLFLLVCFFLLAFCFFKIICWFSIKGSILRHKSRRPKLARKLASRGGGRQGRKEKQGVGENDAWQPPRPSSQTCRSPEKK